MNFLIDLCCYLEALVGGSWIQAWYTLPLPSESSTMLNFFFEEVSLGAQQNNPPVCFQRFHIHCWRSQTSFCTLCLKTELPAKYANPLKQEQQFRFRVYFQGIALCTVQTKSQHSTIILCIRYMYLSRRMGY